ncbi:hypothetical protein AB0I72_26690 [Nocardiopsis sp. NPDC049922]|uniref:hypothetical protein n=1 Tax=Nocardiopsis sp. NPDC049922 TaxID=3155157 RepID=UPI0033EBDBE8
MQLNPLDENPDDVNPDNLTEDRIREMVEALNQSDDWQETAQEFPETWDFHEESPDRKAHIDLFGVHEIYDRRVILYRDTDGKWKATGFSRASRYRVLK